MQITDLRNLFNEMTLEEKVGQTIQLTGDFFNSNNSEITGPLAEMNISDEQISQIGSVLGVTGAKNVQKLQKEYLENSRLGIPLLFMADVIHGYRTIFPIPLGLASSWNTELIEETSAISAKEAAVSGVHVTFSPMVDLVRDPRWGRVMESTGEDPYLNGRYAEAYVKGYQGDSLQDDLSKVVSCVKHFAAYGAPAGGRDYNTVDLSERVLREYYFSGYEKALEAGSKMVMTSFNTINGIPATSNKWLMDDVLRKELGFEEVTITDWSSMSEIVAHRTAKDLKEAAEQSIKVTVDIDMMSGSYAKHLLDLAEEDEKISVLVDESAWRILKLKNDLGLFENPYRAANAEDEKKVVFSREHRNYAKKAAEESIVLLKNKQNILPINESQKIALIGPKKDSRDVLGPWSLNGIQDEAKTLKESLIDEIGEQNLSIFNEEEIYEGLYSYKLSELHEADIILLAIGETSDRSGEAASVSDIQLPKDQQLLIQELEKLDIPLVAVVYSGRPLDLSELDDKIDGIIQAWFPGTEGSKAITNILTGKVNPSGKLTMTFPRNVGQVPIYYNLESTGRPYTEDKKKEKYLSRYLDTENTPLYPFGYGLSYTTFKYSEIELSDERIDKKSKLTARVSVTNTGEVPGTEIVQLYIQDKVSQVIRPVKELKNFERVYLEAGQTKEIIFELTEKDLRYVHADLTKFSDFGEFTLMIGPNSQEYKQTTFYLN